MVYDTDYYGLEVVQKVKLVKGFIKEKNIFDDFFKSPNDDTFKKVVEHLSETIAYLFQGAFILKEIEVIKLKGRETKKTACHKTLTGFCCMLFMEESDLNAVFDTVTKEFKVSSEIGKFVLFSPEIPYTIDNSKNSKESRVTVFKTNALKS